MWWSAQRGRVVKVMGASGETTLAERVCQSGNLQGACLEADSRVFNYFRFAALVPVFL